MNRPLTVGVTGGIGSGKSIVCQVFESLGVPIYYADDRAKALLIEDKELKKAIIELFGTESYQNGQLNRSFLATKVFADEVELAKMNALVHPAVAEDFRLFVEKHLDLPLVIKEAALLFETGSYKQLDYNIAVIAKKDIRLKRVLLRDVQRSEEQVMQIMQKQTSDAQRKKLANWIITNNEEELVIPQVMNIHGNLSELTSD
jgi:dephospho-CoA kinase